MVTVKRQPLRGTSALNGTLKSGCNQVGTILGRYAMCNYFPGKEIQYDADVYVFLIDLEAGDIANPDTVRLGYMKLSLQDVLLFLHPDALLIIPFRVGGDTL